MPISEREAFLDGLAPNTLAALPYLFDFWALPHQVAPDGDWRTWLILGGRGSGKTRAGAEWVRAQVEGSRPLDRGACTRVALVGETFDQVRDVMVFGDSGIIACSPPDRVPKWNAGRRMLEWPNGATAQAFSAQEPENLRGPQFDAAWIDELAKWKKADATWDMLQFALRLGDAPRQVVTTTPRSVKLLQTIMVRDSTVMSRAPTEANGANLAGSFLKEIRARYAGTRLGRQELDGEFLEQADGALWSRADLDRITGRGVPELSRIVVAVDPPVSGHDRSDACGIIVAGAVMEGPPHEWRAVVLEDASVQGMTPIGWAERVAEVFARHGADRVVAEINQGGDMVEAVLRQVAPTIPYKGVHARRGKAMRAEPVAALYEQGRVGHVPGLGDLEDQMAMMTTSGYLGQGSPDRVDALVWALHELMIEPAAHWRRPQLRGL